MLIWLTLCRTEKSALPVRENVRRVTADRSYLLCIITCCGKTSVGVLEGSLGAAGTVSVAWSLWAIGKKTVSTQQVATDTKKRYAGGF